MRIDLPCCGFKNCQHCFDGNCTKPSEQEKCEYWYLLHKELYGTQPHWIPNTKETVPKDPLRKQIQLNNGWIITGWFDGEDWFPVPGVGAGLLFDNVEAWCELPEPYQPESEG